MKPIIKSILLFSVLALIFTGCQKGNDDEINVTLKNGVTYITPWQSGNAAFECAAVGGCGGGSYKIDEWMGGTREEGGIKITENSTYFNFTWTSLNPVCKIIVKAGRGAYIYAVGGAFSGTITLPGDAKAISHVTFCFDRSDLIVAVKAFYWYSSTSGYYTWAGSGGSLIPEYTGLWCNDYMGITTIPTTSTIDLYRGWEYLDVGGFTINGDQVTVTLSSPVSPLILDKVYIFVGTLDEFKATIVNGCPYYEGYETNLWQYFDANNDSNQLTFTVKLGGDR